MTTHGCGDPFFHLEFIEICFKITLMENQKLYVVMVGLPARGKSTIANRLKENLTKDSIKTRIFNNGALRRRLDLKNTSFAEFYDPKNTEGAALRERIALMNLERANRYLANHGQVSILDATNVSIKRRNKITSLLKGPPLLFIECINDDPEILTASILRKIAHAEFNHFEKKAAIQNFRIRIDYYKTNYYATSPEKDPFNSVSQSYRVLRGGSWHYRAELAQVTSRDGPKAGMSNYNYGFRVAKNK